MIRRGPLWIGALAVLVVLGWLVGYPLIITLLEALRADGAWTLGNFGEFVSRGDEWLALWRSLWISVLSVVFSALVGVPLAFLFERTQFPGRRILGSLIALPVALPPLVGVIAFLFLFGESGFISRGVQALFNLDEAPWRLAGPGAILLVHAYSMYVYFYLFTRAGLRRLDGAVLEAAASLGAGRVRTLVRITLPLLAPALSGAALLTFMTSLASFSAPYLFGGGFRVMTTQIVASKLKGNLAMAQVEAVTLAALALVGLWAMQKFGGDRVPGGAVRGVAPGRRQIASGWAAGSAAVAGWLLAVLLLLPHLTLLLISFVPAGTWTVEAVPPVLSLVNYGKLLGSLEQLRPIANSLWMAAVATVGAIAIGLVTARLAGRLRQLSDRGSRFLAALLESFLALPWAIPGTVFAVALAFTFSVDAPLQGRFVLVGTAWLLPIAYLVRSLPLTGRSALAGLAQLDPSLEEAAASLGSSRWRTLRLVVLPVIRPALVAGAGLAFITALGDFVTSVVLYTFGTRPISIEILSQLRLQESGVAAVYGVVLMVASAAAFLVWGQEETA